jgi:hypothetical protein
VRARPGLQLGAGIGDVAAHGVGGDDQLARDLVALLPAGERGQDLALARRQHLPPGGGCSGVERLRREHRQVDTVGDVRG